MGALRFFLALSVIFSHNGIRVPGVEGHLAVLAFFVISGFYMALVLNEKYQDNVSGFYMARFLRLWPAYFIVVVITLVFIRPFNAGIYVSLVAASAVWASTLTMLFSQLLWWFGLDPAGHLVFLSSAAQQVKISPLTNAAHMQHMWSVGVEICFYMIAPFIARKPKLIVALLAFFLCIYIFIKTKLFFHHPLDHRSALNSFWLFLLGMGAWWIWKCNVFKLSNFKFSWQSWSVCGVVTSFIIIALIQLDFNNPWLNIFCYLFFALMLIPIFHYTSQSKVDRFIGEMSYPVYLVHWPIIAYLITQHRGSWMWSLIISVITLVFALILYLFIDRKIEMFRQSFARKRRMQEPRQF